MTGSGYPLERITWCGGESIGLSASQALPWTGTGVQVSGEYREGCVGTFARTQHEIGRNCQIKIIFEAVIGIRFLPLDIEF
jgi:hypothetical protein